MRHRLRVLHVLLMIILAVGVIAVPSSTVAANQPPLAGDAQELIIGLTQAGLAQTDLANVSVSNAGPRALTRLLQSYGATSVRQLYNEAVFVADAEATKAGLTGTLVVTVPRQVNLMQMMADVEAIAEVDYAEPNFRVSLVTDPDTSTADDEATVSNTSDDARSGKSANGVDAAANEFLWVGQIRMSADDRLLCGATLIDNKWLLTAAQCVRGRPINAMYVRIGARDANDTAGTQERLIKRAVIHPNYNANTKVHDIALIELRNAFKNSRTARAQVIGHSNADKYAYKAGARSVMVGWGMNRVVPGRVSGNLRKSNATVLSDTQCRTKLGSAFQTGKLCADPVDRVTTSSGLCNSDIGSGLMAFNGGRPRIIGVASTSLGCPDNTPSLYTDVSQYWSWIDKIADFDSTADPLVSVQWGLHNALDSDIDVLDAWGVTRGDASSMVAVVDSGVKYDHPDLDSERMLVDRDYDFVNNDDNAMDDNGHGTHVAGIIAATAENSQGGAGVCSDCAILPVKVLDAKGSGSADGVAKGIRYAADQGADIINLSLGMDPNCGCSKTIANAVNYAYNKGSFIIAAAGNDGVGKLSYPASSSRVFPVGSSTLLWQRSSFSNYGETLEVVAPGSDIMSTYTNPTYKFASGTSMAAPMVAGVAGLVLSTRPGLTNPQMWWLLRNSTKEIASPGFDVQTGYGLISAFRAVTRPVAGIVNLGDDTCSSEPSSGCGDCSTGIALGVDRSDVAMTTLYRFRDEVLSTTAVGQRWTDMFYAHTLELGYMFVRNAQLRTNAQRVIVALTPMMQSLLDPTARDVRFTRRDFDMVEQFKNRLLTNASPRLTESVNDEWQRVNPAQYVGQSVRVIWQTLSR